VIVCCFFKKIGTLNKHKFEKQAEYPALEMQAFGRCGTNQWEKCRIIIQIINR
jgi:hypothetical protein